MTADPIGFKDGPNRYAYCVNNPIGRIDLYGLNSNHFGWCQRDYNMPEMAWRRHYAQNHAQWLSSRSPGSTNWLQMLGRSIECIDQQTSFLPDRYKFGARVGRLLQGKDFFTYEEGYFPTHSIPYGKTMAADGSYTMIANGILTYYEDA